MSETIENLPAEKEYVAFDPANKIFTIYKTTDELFLGVYQVVIKKEFEQYNIDKSTTTIMQTIEFELTVTSCTVESFSVVQRPEAAIAYTLGEPSFTFGPYEFAQTPDCGYSPEISFIEMPSEIYIEHSESEKAFTIKETNEPDFLGVYNVQIIGQFEQLNIDRTLTIVSATIEF